MTLKAFAAGVFLLVVAGLCPAARAMPDFQPDATDAIFSATDVVIVAHQRGDDFQVRRSLRGSLHADQTITLPGFKLQKWGVAEDYPVGVPMTDQTRILLFLRPDPHDFRRLQIVDDGWGYYFRDAGGNDALVQMADAAIARREKWDAAVAMKPSRQKVKALWPFLQGGTDGMMMTLAELQKLEPMAGDYLAEQLPWYKPEERGLMMMYSDRIQSPKLHEAIIADVQGAQAAVDIYLAGKHLDHLRAGDQWPDAVRDWNGEIGYGLRAISFFKDPKDLPLIRGMVPWLLRNQFDPEVEHCIDLMADCPDPANVPTLQAIWDNYRSRGAAARKSYESSIPAELARALANTGGASALGLLAEMTTDDWVRPDAQAAMTKTRSGR